MMMTSGCPGWSTTSAGWNGRFGGWLGGGRTAGEEWVERVVDEVDFRNAWLDRDGGRTLSCKLDLRLMPFSVRVGADGKIYRYDVHSDDLLRYAKIMLKED